jgi:hypothetical protein
MQRRPPGASDPAPTVGADQTAGWGLSVCCGLRMAALIMDAAAPPGAALEHVAHRLGQPITGPFSLGLGWFSRASLVLLVRFFFHKI